MKRSRRTWWVLYALGAALAIGTLGWISRTVLELERREHLASGNAQHQESLRLSLWRMDSWFGPHLAQEAARPFYEYLAFYAQERAYTRILNRIESGEVLTPSPLLTFRSELVQLHFQVDEQGALSSPQVPEGNLLDLAEASFVDAGSVGRQRAVLDALAQRVQREGLVRTLAIAEAQLSQVLTQPRQQEANIEQSAEWLKNRQEVTQRAKSSYQIDAQTRSKQDLGANWATAEMVTIEIGPLVPLWIDLASDEPELLFVRRVQGAERVLLQGFLANWPALRARLHEQIADLLPDARLEPVVDAPLDEREAGLSLASIPALLRAPLPPPLPIPSGSPARATLLLSWVAALLAIAAVGWALRSSVLYGEKRSRFASTVTHELRTPLTTFRMYSEMLARDMVPEADRAEYLETLQREADRLAGLVENVLAYARLEDGRSPLRRRRVEVGEILERSLPMLDRRAREAGIELACEADGARGALLETDPEAVQQILFNLVDNACKYGRSSNGDPLRLTAHEHNGHVELRVVDHGGGVPAAHARSIFHPFERGGRDPADPNPGVGLGLALSRGLARDLGGDLVLETGDAVGACFLLTLRRAS